MDDTVRNKIVHTVKETIEEHNGIDTELIDVQGMSSWTDFFIISTVSSAAHLRGLIKYIRKSLSTLDVHILNRQKKFEEGGWVLLDCGFFVIHLMDKENREFYSLEKLWHRKPSDTAGS